MQTPEKVNLKIYQGATFTEVLRWESHLKTYSLITSISKTAPVVITSPGHAVPVGWRVKIKNVLGMKEINSDQYVYVTAVEPNLVTIGDINALGFSDYTSGGVIEYNTPKSLAGITARMQIRPKISSTEVLLELTTENGGIIINDTNKSITISIAASATAALQFKSGVYSLELINGVEVIPLVTGGVTLEYEVTRAI